jgi:hypothetical protein
MRASLYLYTYIKFHHFKNFLELLKQKVGFIDYLASVFLIFSRQIETSMLTERIFKVREILLSHK